MEVCAAVVELIEEKWSGACHTLSHFSERGLLYEEMKSDARLSEFHFSLLLHRLSSAIQFEFDRHGVFATINSGLRKME